LTGAVLGLGVAAVGWACVPGSYLHAGPSFGPPGSSFTISGQEFDGGSVEIRWGSQTGPLLASASGSAFSVSVQAPADAVDGVYLVFALTRNADGSVRETNRTPFEVTRTGAAGVVADGGWGQQKTDPGARTPAPATSPLAPTVSKGAAPVPPAARALPQAGQQASSQTSGAPTSGSAPGGAESSTGSSGSAPASQARFFAYPGRGAGATTSAAVEAMSRPSAATAARRTGSPSGRSATADLWSGFGTGGSPSFGAGAGSAAEEPGSRLALPATLVGLGLVGLLGGTLMAGRRRRARPVRASGR
jgi:hypothetical protein